MIIKLTEFGTNREIFFDTQHFIYCKIIGEAKPHTFIQCVQGGLNVQESPDQVHLLMKCQVISLYCENSEPSFQEFLGWAKKRKGSYLAVIERLRE